MRKYWEISCSRLFRIWIGIVKCIVKRSLVQLYFIIRRTAQGEIGTISIISRRKSNA